jgi:hypothetical protein
MHGSMNIKKYLQVQAVYFIALCHLYRFAAGSRKGVHNYVYTYYFNIFYIITPLVV